MCDTVVLRRAEPATTVLRVLNAASMTMQRHASRSPYRRAGVVPPLPRRNWRIAVPLTPNRMIVTSVGCGRARKRRSRRRRCSTTADARGDATDTGDTEDVPGGSRRTKCADRVRVGSTASSTDVMLAPKKHQADTRLPIATCDSPVPLKPRTRRPWPSRHITPQRCLHLRPADPTSAIVLRLLSRAQVKNVPTWVTLAWFDGRAKSLLRLTSYDASRASRHPDG